MIRFKSPLRKQRFSVVYIFNIRVWLLIKVEVFAAKITFKS